MSIRACAAALALCLALPSPAQTPPAAAPKVLRYAIRVAETGFDPPQISDLYSSTMAANMFDAPYQIEFLARPVRLRPNTAVAMPESSADFRTWTIRLRPGIYFADDPAFKGKKRELVAEDYVYSFKRLFDPRWKSPELPDLRQQPGDRPGRGAPGRPPEQDRVRLRRAGRGPARPRPLHLPVQTGASQPALPRTCSAIRRGSARWRARWSSTTATASWSTRWAPARSCSRPGAAVR